MIQAQQHSALCYSQHDFDLFTLKKIMYDKHWERKSPLKGREMIFLRKGKEHGEGENIKKEAL